MTGDDGPKSAKNCTFSNFELNFWETDMFKLKMTFKNGISDSKLTKIDMWEVDQILTTSFCHTV